MSSATGYSDMNPSPRVVIDIDDADLDPAVATVTVWQLSKWGQAPVRNAIAKTALGGLVVTDYEAPAGVPLTYRVEQFDASGASLGFVLSLSSEVEIPRSMAVLSDPLAPGRALLVQAELRFGERLTRSRPTAVYQAGNRSIALSGILSAFRQVPLRCITFSEADREMMWAILDAPLMLVRTDPSMRLPGAFYASIADAPMIPFDSGSGGETDVWDITGNEITRPTIDIIVAVYSYDRYKAYLDTLHPPTPGTYDDAAEVWSTYIDAMRQPPPIA